MAQLIAVATLRLKNAFGKGGVDLTKLNESGECKFLAIADAELTLLKTAGLISERPSVVASAKNTIRGVSGRKKRIFAAVQTEEGDTIFLLFHPKKGVDDISVDDDVAGLFEGAKPDKAFTADFGESILTSNNTVVTKSPSDHTFVFRPYHKEFNIGPVDIDHAKKVGFELKFVVDGDHENSEKNRTVTEAWIKSDILPLEHNFTGLSAKKPLEEKEGGEEVSEVGK